MEAALAELGERYECEVEADSTELDLEDKGLTELPAVVCQLPAVEELFLDNGFKIYSFHGVEEEDEEDESDEDA